MTIKSFLEKYIWLVIVLAAIPILVIVVFSICADWLHCITMTGGDWATLIGAILAYVGTVLLGLLAFWQNGKANETNKRLIQIQNQKLLPVLELQDVKFAIVNENADKKSIENHVVSIGKSIALESQDKLNDKYAEYNIIDKIFTSECQKLYKLEVRFYLKNISESIIQKIIVNSVNLLYFGNRNKDGNRVGQEKLILPNKRYNSISRLIKTGDMIILKLELHFDNFDIYHSMLKEMHQFQFDIKLISAYTTSSEKIKCEGINSETATVEYSFCEKEEDITNS